MTGRMRRRAFEDRRLWQDLIAAIGLGCRSTSVYETKLAPGFRADADVIRAEAFEASCRFRDTQRLSVAIRPDRYDSG